MTTTFESVARPLLQGLGKLRDETSSEGDELIYGLYVENGRTATVRTYIPSRRHIPTFVKISLNGKFEGHIGANHFNGEESIIVGHLDHADDVTGFLQAFKDAWRGRQFRPRPPLRRVAPAPPRAA